MGLKLYIKYIQSSTNSGKYATKISSIWNHPKRKRHHGNATLSWIPGEENAEIYDMKYELCGTYLTTRSNNYEKEVTLPSRDNNSVGRNLLQHDDGYAYQIKDPTVNKETYKKLSGTRWYLMGVIRIWRYWM